MARLSFRCDDRLVEQVDAARGLIARETWLRTLVEAAMVNGGLAALPAGFLPVRAVERALSEAKEPALLEQAGPGSVPSPEGVRPAAPAERRDAQESIRRAAEAQLAERPYRQTEKVRSSAQIKRDVRPIPKKGKT